MCFCKDGVATAFYFFAQNKEILKTKHETQKNVLIIAEDEISTFTKDLYKIVSSQVVGKTDPFKGEKSFVLCSLEQLIGLLSFPTKNDKMIIQHTKNILRASKNIQEYQNFLRYMSPSHHVTKYAMSMPKLTTSERSILNELLMSNYNEYLMKSDFVSCCYSAMNAFLIAAYCIISKGIEEKIST